jgi:hypothetical protein
VRQDNVDSSEIHHPYLGMLLPCARSCIVHARRFLDAECSCYYRRSSHSGQCRWSGAADNSALRDWRIPLLMANSEKVDRWEQRAGPARSSMRPAAGSRFAPKIVAAVLEARARLVREAPELLAEIDWVEP